MSPAFTSVGWGVLALLVSLAAARAVVTQKVTDDTFAAFGGGDFENVSLASDGRLELAPALTNLASVADPIIWAAVQDRKGDIFFGTGNQGKIYKLTPQGEWTTFFAPNEVMVHALAIDRQGRLYAATSPNGRVYRLDADGRAEVFCNPDQTYLWAMTFGPDGSLYLATGDHGKILRVPPGGATPAKAEVYFETPEANVTALALDAQGRLLAGTSPHGYLYRIDKTNHGFVLFNSGQKEINNIAVADHGVIYVSTFAGNPKMSAADSDSSSAASNVVVTAGGGGPSSSAIYRVDTNGFYERFWSAPEGEAIYSLVRLPDGRLLAGTGDTGRIYSIADARHWKLLQTTRAGAQVAVLLPDGGEPKRCFAATSHPAKIYRLDFALAEKGVYTSKVFDARQESLWGRLHPEADVPDGAQLEFSTRSGNTDQPEKTWSDWSAPEPLRAEIPITSPPARYWQYRVEFRRGRGSPGATASLRRVQFYYQNENAAPVFTRLRVITQGFGIVKMPMPQLESPPVNLDQLLDGDASAQPPASGAGIGTLPTPLREKKSPGYCTVVWQANDPNGDRLVYSVVLRAEGDQHWTTLVDKTEDTFYSFDTTGFREGLYWVRVTASDLPSNTPATARTNVIVSEPFLIDNTPSVLTVQTQSAEKNRARIVVNAADGASVIESAGYSLDGRDEVALRPDDLIFDSTHETFTIELADLSPGAHSLLVRVTDEAKNTAVLKLNFETK
jgi:sugar lactone lactonase YvrE